MLQPLIQYSSLFCCDIEGNVLFLIASSFQKLFSRKAKTRFIHLAAQRVAQWLLFAFYLSLTF